jgi:hypothetical protein
MIEIMFMQDEPHALKTKMPEIYVEIEIIDTKIIETEIAEFLRSAFR